MPHRSPSAIEEHLDDFGIDHRVVSAFSRSGLWDSDPNEHLNVHSSHQIIVVIQGMIMLTDEMERRPLYRRMAAFIPAGKAHRASAPGNGMTISCHSLFVNTRIFPAPDGKIHLFETSPLCEALLTKMNERNLVDITEGILGSCLELFLKLLPGELRNATGMVRLPEARSERNRAIVQFLQAGYRSRVELSDLARVVPLSVRQISRSFKQEMKISVMEYLRVYRLLQASVLLLDPVHKVIDVANDSGYESVSTFYEDFKRYFGLPPTRFRGHSMGEL
jgi:AraC-like DNA-binding protein/mannose-6-phosphate isomerase-like protein (cupin superfamily)